LCPAKRIVCLVVDEAHQAQGDHAYCLLVRNIRARTKYFRVLALTATPGSDQLAIQNVLSNLLISSVAVRSETDADVAPFIHHTQQQLEEVKLTLVLEDLKRKFELVLGIPISRLFNMRVLFTEEISKVHTQIC
jgi:ERCC4-related helicase